jgi:hypothetical protein
MVDENDNGVSDIWERHYNSGELIANFDPANDPDGDDWSNAREAIAGTDPFSAAVPDGYLLPDIAHFPATYTVDPNGNPIPATAEGYIVHWTGEIGKRYSLFCSPDMTTGSWFPVDFPVIALNPEMLYGFSPSSSDGTPPPALFWRAAVDDVDSDGDGFTDYEEDLMHTDPYIADSDADGLPDDWEILHGLDPYDNGTIDPDNGPDGDPDLDGYSNLEEYLGGSDSGSGASIPGIGAATSVSAGDPPLLLTDFVSTYGFKYGFAGNVDYLDIPDARLSYLHRVNTLTSTDTDNDGDGGTTTTTDDIDPETGATTSSTVSTGAGGTDYGGTDWTVTNDTYRSRNGTDADGSGEISTRTETLSNEYTSEQLQSRVEGTLPAYTGNYIHSNLQLAIIRLESLPRSHRLYLLPG